MDSERAGRAPLALAAPRGTATLALFGGTIFVGSALVFLVEPMVGKMLLPLLGGTPAVWAVTLVFFQAVLLVGYAFAHVSVRLLSVRRQSLLQLGVLLAPFAFLPIAVARDLAPPDSHQEFWLLGVLVVAVGAPFFVVSTASPVLQRWFAAVDHKDAKDPYFLYAASNAGSLVGLLAYPVLIESHLTLAQQSRMWSLGYALFAALAALCALRLLTVPAALGRDATPTSSSSAAIPWRQRLRWLGLAALPSSLMLGTTSYITTDIGAVPLLWVVPLAAYLVSFVFAFARRRVLRDEIVNRALVVSAVLVTATSIIHGFVLPIWALVGVHTMNLFLVALFVHRRLAGERPPADRLTEFYLLLSAGGVCGGIFNALLAPVILPTILEYPIAIVIALLLRPGPRGPRAGARFFRKTGDLIVPLLVGLAVIVALAAVNAAGVLDRWTIIAIFGGALLAVAALARRPVRFAMGIAILLAVPVLAGLKSLHTERTFFGVLRVEEGEHRTHRFVHGTTIHGVQSFAAGESRRPLTYYSRRGPIGQVFAAGGRTISRVGVIGLGAGSLAAYGHAGDRFTFYEIDPAVARIASNRRYFTFLSDSAADIRVVVGDGRLEIANAADGSYDVIVLDAFSGDSVPVHLLTREAVELYLRKLAPHGLLAFHVTNNYLDLRPVVGSIARARGLTARAQTYRPSASERGDDVTQSTWVVVARTERDLGSLADDRRWRPVQQTDRRVWTDQFSNILSVAKRW